MAGLSRLPKSRACSAARALRAHPEHGDGAAVPAPAGDVVADRNRPLFAVRNRAHAMTLDATRDQIVAHCLCTTRAECDVVLARAAFVGMAFNRELRILTVVGEPLRLLVERRA